MPLVTFHWSPVAGYLVKRILFSSGRLNVSKLRKTRDQMLESVRFYLDHGYDVTVEVFT